jgi:hypothetical protein
MRLRAFDDVNLLKYLWQFWWRRRESNPHSW